MKTALVRLLFVFVFLTLTRFAVAGDFVSAVIQPTDTPPPITVPADRFLVVRNFTQEGPITMARGSVSVITTTFPAGVIVLTAAIVDPATKAGSLEPINNVVITGPATVMVTPGETNCFITYRKGTD